ncbi:hypothetical protein BDF19DRAFT_426305 [Syncephalis fuscata]|nr:hypothetical protein BDF19DRAFT_426295 [Syncephalis fuscata]KAI9591459.1 hypothetical protein BDF19DRAFT_426305 [Syncephalis fuscata]
MAATVVYTRSIIYATMPLPVVQKRLFSETDIEAGSKPALKKAKLPESVPVATQALLPPNIRCVGTQAETALCSVAVQTEEVLSSNKAVNTTITSLSGFSFSSHYYCSSSSSSIHTTPMDGVEYTGALKLAPAQPTKAAVAINSTYRVVPRGGGPRRTAASRLRRRTAVRNAKKEHLRH